MSTAIVWFRRDLRLADNPALTAAAKAHDTVLAVYVHAPEEDGEWAPGAASRWWLHHSLKALDASLDRLGGRLHVMRGPSLDALRALIAATDAEAVYFNRLYEPRAIRRDKALRKALEGRVPELAEIDLVNFKVRILDETHGTDAVTRVLLESSDGHETWGAIGVHENVIEASWDALVDSLEAGMVRTRARA